MKLYLASEIDRVAKAIADDIGDPKNKKLAFIYTSYEYVKSVPEWLRNNRNSLKDAGFDLFDYTITGKTTDDFDSDLGIVDIIHVNGGDTLYLMQQSQKTKFDKWILEAVRNGKIYTGSSAGSTITAEDLEFRYKGNGDEDYELANYLGYGFLDFVVMPHWGRKDYRQKYQEERFDLAYTEDQKLIFLNDNQYIKVINDMYRIVDVRDLD